ncbi:hypothetical protein [Carnobacterium maltaromaticum]|uniref:hypothetical protein n=1 Tax=Carnobacterium maltaromaticum TaxID=2751 RepID=UPI00295EA326|nr:hypothetical protein [Carnobacterium maltaromaticum]
MLRVQNEEIKENEKMIFFIVISAGILAFLLGVLWHKVLFGKLFKLEIVKK